MCLPVSWRPRSSPVSPLGRLVVPPVFSLDTVYRSLSLRLPFPSSSTSFWTRRLLCDGPTGSGDPHLTLRRGRTLSTPSPRFSGETVRHWFSVATGRCLPSCRVPSLKTSHLHTPPVLRSPTGRFHFLRGAHLHVKYMTSSTDGSPTRLHRLQEREDHPR